MRTNEERILAMHQRAGEIGREVRAKKARVYGSVSLAAGLMAAVLIAVMVPDMVQSISTEQVSNAMMASIFTNSTALGYIVVAVLAFLLGAAVTIFCFHLRKWKNEDPEDRS